MAIEFYHNDNEAALVCTTTDRAFGPVLRLTSKAEHLYFGLAEYVVGLLDWLRPADARILDQSGLLEQRVLEFDEHCSGLVQCEHCFTNTPKAKVICDECRLEYSYDEQ